MKRSTEEGPGRGAGRRTRADLEAGKKPQVWLGSATSRAGAVGRCAAARGRNQMANHMEMMKTDEITSPLL